LDQGHWVALARARNGKSQDKALQDILSLVLASAEQGQVSYPLSAAHYLETYRHGEPGARQRLGTFMAELSQFHAITGPNEVLVPEVTRAFQSLTGQPTDPEPQVFGRGHAHAFGLAEAEYRKWDARAALVARRGEAAVVDELELMLLAGPPERLPFGDMALPTRAYDQRQLDFELETAARLQEHGHSADLARRVVLAQEAVDVMAILSRLASGAGVALDALLGDDQKMTEFMYALPAKGAITAMRVTAHANPTVKRELNDLTDITALGMAAAYCDVVVAEKHWGNLMSRTPGRFKATVITRLRDLPALLLA
jgi:hypothetical protein